MPVAIGSLKEYEEKVTGAGEGSRVLVHFGAAWCDPCKQLDEALDGDEFKSFGSEFKFYKVDAEEVGDAAEAAEVTTVPQILIFKDGVKKFSIAGAKIPEIKSKLSDLSGVVTDQSVPLNDRLKALTERADVMLFMKGDRDAPRCGFSGKMIDALNDTKADYSTFDILTNEEVRQGLKEYAKWPTYPQLWVKGELVGGLDIVKELIANGEFASTLKGE